MPPRWGFSSFGVGGYNDVVPPELKSGSSAAARTAALIQWQWSQSEGLFPTAWMRLVCSPQIGRRIKGKV